jgi:hypothetical protein
VPALLPDLNKFMFIRIDRPSWSMLPDSLTLLALANPAFMDLSSAATDGAWLARAGDEPDDPDEQPATASAARPAITTGDSVRSLRDSTAPTPLPAGGGTSCAGTAV